MLWDKAKLKQEYFWQEEGGGGTGEIYILGKFGNEINCNFIVVL